MRLAPRRILLARGFTLIEIMIVIAIVAIVMTAGVPMLYRALKKDLMAQAVTDVLEGCKTARDSAILQGVPYEFVVVRENGTFLVQPGKDRGGSARGDAGADPAPVAAQAGSGSLMAGFPRRLGDGVSVELVGVNFIPRMEDPEARVRFFPNGTSDEFAIVLLGRDGRRTVTTDVVTGLAYEVLP